MAESNITTKILISSQKSRKILDNDATITSMDTLVISEGFHKFSKSYETIMEVKTLLDYNELTQYEVSVVYQYSHQLIKESNLWFLEDTPIALLSEYQMRCG